MIATNILPKLAAETPATSLATRNRTAPNFGNTNGTRTATATEGTWTLILSRVLTADKLAVECVRTISGTLDVARKFATAAARNLAANGRPAQAEVFGADGFPAFSCTLGGAL